MHQPLPDREFHAPAPQLGVERESQGMKIYHSALVVNRRDAGNLQICPKHFGSAIRQVREEPVARPEPVDRDIPANCLGQFRPQRCWRRLLAAFGSRSRERNAG